MDGVSDLLVDERLRAQPRLLSGRESRIQLSGFSGEEPLEQTGGLHHLLLAGLPRGPKTRDLPGLLDG
jgi:hypothetical protein